MKADIRNYGKTLMDYRNSIVQNALGINVPYPEVGFLKDTDDGSQ